MTDEPPVPEPDDKDWTWVLERPCPQCGFNASGRAVDSLPGAIRDAVSGWPAVLAGPEATRRPQPRVWSPLEYACHVRDVLTLFAARVRLMLEQDDPTFDNWDQDATALAERYWEQDPARVAEQIEAAAGAAVGTFGQVSGRQWSRTGVRSNGSRFTVATLGWYFLHDLTHHAWDVRAGR